METLRVGLIGAGTIAQSAHLPAYARLRDVTLAAARAGKHVLRERPMAATPAQALPMQKAVEEAGVAFMLAAPRRYQSDARLPADMAASGQLGDVYYGKTAIIRRRGTPVGWFTDRAKSGGGPVADIGAHCIDCRWYLMGRPRPVSVRVAASSRIGNFAPKDVFRLITPDGAADTFDTEDSAAGFIRFENNARTLFEVSRALNAPSQGYTQSCGSKGGASLGPLTICGEENGFLVDKRPVTIDMDRFAYEIGHFAACVREKRTPVSSLADAVTLQRILSAA